MGVIEHLSGNGETVSVPIELPTEYDWTRHLWDLTTSYDVPVDTIFNIWDEANPHNWNADGIGTGGDYPAERMHDAAYDVGGSTLQVDYDDCAGYNGTWR